MEPLLTFKEGGMFWTYVLENLAGQFYVGHTRDLAVRLDDHNRVAVQAIQWG